MSVLDCAKQAAACLAVKDIRAGDVVGIGSGSTVVFAVERLAERVQKENLYVQCIPTSFQSKQLLNRYKLPMTDLKANPMIDICIDGADEVDSYLNLIKGGGACLLQEKIVASCSEELIIIADYTKDSVRLGDQHEKGIPIEVTPMAYVPIQNKIEHGYGGKAELRMGVAKAGPLITDNGNFILDWKDFKQEVDWKRINTELSLIPGIVETGLFINMASKAYFGMADGTIKTKVACPACTIARC